MTEVSMGGGSGTIGSADWKLQGNAGTDPNVNFIGTSDSTDLVVKTNNLERIFVLSDGKVGINGLPDQQLSVDGSFVAISKRNIENIYVSIYEGLGNSPVSGENVLSARMDAGDRNYFTFPDKIAFVETNYSLDSNEVYTKLGFNQTGISNSIIDIRESGIKIGNFNNPSIEIIPATIEKIKLNLVEYADDAAADADTDLVSGSLYKLTGSRAIYQKP